MLLTLSLVLLSVPVFASEVLLPIIPIDDPDPAPGRGEMNGDGAVTSNDAIHLLRHTLNGARYPISQSGEMNGDGRVNSSDAIYLLRFTMDPERYPLR